MSHRFLIVFLGIHGSAKTTQAQLLCDSLHQQGIKARYVHQMSPEGGLEGWGNRFLFRPLHRWFNWALGRAALGTRDDKEPPRLRRLLQQFAVTGTATRGVLQTWARLVRANEPVLIFDRYSYDALIRAHWWYGHRAPWESLFLRLVPTPDLIFYMEAQPEQAWHRHKGQEWSLEQLVWQKEVYDAWISRTKKANPAFNCRLVQGTLPLEAAQQEIAQEVLAVFYGQSQSWG